MIRILPRYIFRELLGSFILSLVLIVSLVLAGLALQLLYRGLDVVQLRALIPYLVIYSLPHALPASLLTSAVMTFGRLSGDNEITAMRSSGIHLHVVVTPALLWAVAVTLLSLHLNCNVLPHTYFQIDRLKLVAGQSLAKHVLETRQELTVPPYQIQTAKVVGDRLEDVTILEYDADYVKQMWWAKEAVIIRGPKADDMALELHDCYSIELGYRDPTQIRSYTFDKIRLPVRDARLGVTKPTKFTHMAMKQLLQRRVECGRYLVNGLEPFPDPKKTKKEAKREVSAIDLLTTGVQGQQRRIADSIKQNQDGIAAARARIETAKLKVSQAEQQTTAAQAAITKTRRQYQALKDAVTPQTMKNRAALLKAIKQHEAAIERTKIAAEEARNDAAQATAKIAKLEQGIAVLQRQAKALAQKRSALMAKRAKIEHMRNVAVAQLGVREITSDIHRRFAMAFSCIAFMLVGVPLGIMARRGNILIGFGVSSLVILLIYYPLMLSGQVLIADKYWAIAPLTWMPNIVLAVIGVAMLQRLFRS